jgi:hypothetical protein
VPLGAMEVETVFALAGLIWSRRRIQRSISAQILMSRMDPTHPSYDKALPSYDKALHEAANYQSELSILEDNPQYAAKCLMTYAVEVRSDLKKNTRAKIIRARQSGLWQFARN